MERSTTLFVYFSWEKLTIYEIYVDWDMFICSIDIHRYVRLPEGRIGRMYRFQDVEATRICQLAIARNWENKLGGSFYHPFAAVFWGWL